MQTTTRHIRSFVLRQGRLTSAQETALEQLWPYYGIELQSTPIQFDNYFPHSAPLIVEIGFGNGLSLAAMAEQHPAMNFLGIEVHRPGVGRLLTELAQRQISNVRICHADAVLVLQQCIAHNSLAGINIFFPDPWPKKRHHKRRLIQPEFVALLYQKLQPQGQLHLATDWQPYAQHMLEVLSAHPYLTNLAGDSLFMPAGYNRPVTKFETRGHRLGHGVWDLVFIK
ncbi:MAG: tRNA (guanosine(46)-N7)-methyltransferase TrmB [Gammaproteobacteria bacterium]